MVIIHTGGNEKIGVGNLSRCKTLANKFIKMGIKSVSMIYEASTILADSFIPNKQVELYVVKNRVEAMEARKDILKRKIKEKSILVTDIYDLTQDDNVLAKKQGFDILIHLNDSGVSEYEPDFMIDQEAFLKPWLVGDNIKFLRGSNYHIIKDEITRLRSENYWDKDYVEKILLCFGGADPEQCIEAFLEFRKIHNSTIKYTVIIGPGVNNERWNKIKKNNINNIFLKRNPNNFNEIMYDTDLLITMGGITSYEGMCLGKPVACISCGSMGFYIEQLDKKKLVKNLGTKEEAFSNLLKLTYSINELKNLAKKGWNEVDGKGTERIVLLIKELLTNTYKE